MNRDLLPKSFTDKIDFSGDCWLWTGSKVGSGGYGGYYENGIQIATHRYSWTRFYGKIPKGMCVCHKCDVRMCVNPEHLFLGTKKDNTHDMINKGRMKNRKGQKQSIYDTITQNQVDEIRKIYQYDGGNKRSENSLRAISEKYGISEYQVRNIIINNVWDEKVRA